MLKKYEELARQGYFYSPFFMSFVSKGTSRRLPKICGNADAKAKLRSITDDGC